MHRFPVFFIIILLVVISGIGAIGVVGADAPGETDGVLVNESTGNETVQDTASPYNLSSEPLGKVNGIWYNDSIPINQSDGLTEEELHEYVSQYMARVEYIRGLQFERMVNVTVVDRETYRESLSSTPADQEYRAWNNQVWKALFIVGADRDVHDEFDIVRADVTGGTYTIGTGNITIIVADPDTVVIDNATLIHELVHALQDQHFDLAAPALHGEVQDEQLARLGLVEGDAEYTRFLYESYCQGDWECVDTPEQDSGAGTGVDPALNFGIWSVLFQPYSDGPAFIHEVVESDGWDGVNALYSSPPNHTREIIHQEVHDPGPHEYRDTSVISWNRYWEQGIDGKDSAGEASIFSMFWYQSMEYSAESIDPNVFFDETHEYSVYNYRSQPSDGWVSDVVVPYYNPGTGEEGYVWELKWETREDGTDFLRAYHRILQAQGAEIQRAGTWVIPDGEFAGAYRIVRDNATVTVVHGPSLASLDEIRPLDETNNGGVGNAVPPGSEPVFEYTPDITPPVEQPGFGFATAVGGVIVLLFVGWRRWS